MLKKLIKYILFTIPAMMFYLILRKVFNKLSIFQAIIVLLVTIFCFYFFFVNIVKAQTVIDDFTYSDGTLTSVSGGVWSSSEKPYSFTAYSPSVASNEVKSLYYSSSFRHHIMTTTISPTGDWSYSIDFKPDSSTQGSHDAYLFFWDINNTGRYFSRQINDNSLTQIVTNEYNTLQVDCVSDVVTGILYNSDYPFGYSFSLTKTGAITCSSTNRFSAIFPYNKYGYYYFDNFIDLSGEPNYLEPINLDVDDNQIIYNVNSCNVVEDITDKSKLLELTNDCHYYIDNTDICGEDDLYSDVTLDFSNFFNYYDYDWTDFIFYIHRDSGATVRSFNSADFVDDKLLIEEIPVSCGVNSKTGYDDISMYSFQFYSLADDLLTPVFPVDFFRIGFLSENFDIDNQYLVEGLAGGGGGGGLNKVPSGGTVYNFLLGSNDVFPIGFFTVFLGSLIDWIRGDVTYSTAGVFSGTFIFPENIEADFSFSETLDDMVDDDYSVIRGAFMLFFYVWVIYTSLNILRRWWKKTANSLTALK